MTKRTLIIILIVLGGLFFLYKFADMFSPGSYGHAETYELNYPEDKVIEAVRKLKNSDTTLAVPIGLKDGKEKQSDHWYNLYFYDKKNNRIMFTWTRPSGRTSTTFAFVAINNGLTLGNWKDVNDDFGHPENKEVIKDFEETILKQVKGILDNDK